MLNSNILIAVESVLNCVIEQKPFGNDLIKGIKITKKGIYAYSKVSYDSSGSVYLADEEDVFVDNSLIPYYEIYEYILNRQRVKIISDNDEKGIRCLPMKTTSTPLSAKNESESLFDIATYIYLVDLYPIDSNAGRELVNKYGFQKDILNTFDSKHFLLEYQASSEVDIILFKLYANNYTDGMFDNYLKNLYGERNGKLTLIDNIKFELIPGEKVLSFSDLGIYVNPYSATKFAYSTEMSAVRGMKYKLPRLGNNMKTIQSFYNIRNYRNGIIVVNNSTLEDFLNNTYPILLTKKDMKYVFNNPLLVSNLSTSNISNNNPYLLVDTLPTGDDDPALTQKYTKEEILQMFIKASLKSKYDVHLVKGINNLSEDIIYKSNQSLVVVFDDIDNLHDLNRLALSLGEVNHKSVIENLICVLDVYNDLVTNITKSLKQMMLDNSDMLKDITVNKEKNLIDYIKNQLGDINTDTIKMSEDVLPAVLIQALTNNTNIDLYSILLKNKSHTFSISVTEGTYRVTCTMIDDSKIDYTIDKITRTSINITLSDTSESGISVITCNDNNMRSDVIFDIANGYLHFDKSVIIVDKDYNISEDSFDVKDNLKIIRDYNINSLTTLLSLGDYDVLLFCDSKGSTSYNEILSATLYTQKTYIIYNCRSLSDFLLLTTNGNETLLQLSYLENYTRFNKQSRKFETINLTKENNLDTKDKFLQHIRRLG